jgi:membrane protein DedA with SNARE-associated domain
MASVVFGLGPLGVFLLMVPESACIPVPSEITLMSAGFAVRSGWMPFWAAVLAATLGNLVGSFIACGIGRASADRTYGRRTTAALAKCDGLFDRHGTRAVFLARLMPLARTFVSLPAGHSRVSIWPFTAMTVLGCAIWAAGLSLLGFLAGAAWAEVGNTVGLVLLGVTVLAVAAWLVAENGPLGESIDDISQGTP